MHVVFTGTYDDGKSALPYPAQVNLEPGQLRITYQIPNQSVPVTVYWQPSRIQSDSHLEITLLAYGNHPTQKLEISDPNFKNYLEKQYPPAVAVTPVKILSASKIPKWFWLSGAAIVASVIGFYMWGLSLLADKAAWMIPQSTDEYVGNQLYQQVVNASTSEPELTGYVQGFLRQIKIQSTYKLQVSVIRDKNRNAFALPGGYLVVHDSILEKMQQPEELAALLGHESGHVQNRHTTRALFRSLGSYLFISYLFGDILGISTILVENADALKSLKYSRHLEEEADTFGFKVLQQNRINPQGMILLFQRLQQAEKTVDKFQTEEFLSTHPPLKSRMQAIRTLIKENPYAVQPPDSMQYFWRRIKQL
ncbi:M48 family metallopeptidase [Adhaeribacter pallidiroseus]|uniref:Putative beta-barrel assembly-enhancing protease n=1 Tax=Adhaeribacter pallidiroseus TaxID=2072847 RepID=A0A369QJM9_9BACT|nr:M48 family metallopeptidase [Adhaeribacter pallidiroseus]RDC64510.1 putative beta-barrel assembly-enhancing protease [Adhaeribacter pallidiroseus]